MKILVLGGGTSPERDVSLRSAAAVTRALEEAGFEVQTADPKNGYDVLRQLAPGTIVLPILHGAEGEDGGTQKILEDAGLPFLGSTSEVSRVCFDKDIVREKLKEAEIPVAEGASVTAETYPENPISKQPHVLKAQRGGSSIGTYIVRNPSELDPAKVDEVFSLDDHAILETLIEGVEITVPVLDGMALPVIEIVAPEDGEFDYENKYNGKSQEICPADSLTSEQQIAAQKLAEQVDKLLGCRHLSRIDMFMQPDGSFIVLEANTIPGLTDQSLFPLSARVAGMPMPQLVTKFIELIKRDYNLS